MEFKTLQDTGTIEEILVVYDYGTSQVIEIISSGKRNPRPINDNDWWPNGFPWYIPTSWIPSKALNEILANELGYLTCAHTLLGYNGSDEQVMELNEKFPTKWCGYFSRGVVYVHDTQVN